MTTLVRFPVLYIFIDFPIGPLSFFFIRSRLQKKLKN